jgi:hypothetical protein
MTRKLPLLSEKLRELGFASYSDYLRSDHWLRFKEGWVPRRSRNKRPVCEFCLDQHARLDFHHMTYRHLGAERLKDVVLICEHCHDRVHRWFKTSRKNSLIEITKAVQSTARRKVA